MFDTKSNPKSLGVITRRNATWNNKKTQKQEYLFDEYLVFP